MKKRIWGCIIAVVLLLICVLSYTISSAAGDTGYGPCPCCGNYRYYYTSSMSQNNGDGTHRTVVLRIYMCDPCRILKKNCFTLISDSNCSHTYGAWKYGSGLDIKTCTATGCNAQVWRNHVHDWKLIGIINNYGLGYTYNYKCACGQIKSTSSPLK